MRMTIPRVVVRLAPFALALVACSPAPPGGSSRGAGKTLEQGRTYTNWLYGAEYGKLWERFTPEFRRVFGSAAELGAFAGKAVTQLGQERRTVDEHVAELKPERIYSRTAAFTAARLPVVIEWTLTKDGAVSGLAVRPARPDSSAANAETDSVNGKR
jgi:hypothetical protein